MTITIVEFNVLKVMAEKDIDWSGMVLDRTLAIRNIPGFGNVEMYFSTLPSHNISLNYRRFYLLLFMLSAVFLFHFVAVFMSHVVCPIYHILSTKLLFAFIFELILIKVFHFATIHNDSFTIFII